MSLSNLFKMNTPRRLVEREIVESEKLLLQAHTNKEHWESQVDYHQKKLKRLRTSWVAMQKDDKASNPKDKPE